MSITETNNKKLLVFISHANEDKSSVRKLYKRLKKDDFDPWLDEERLLPGQNWELEIEKALKASDAILLCCSRESVEKEGFIQREYKRAMYYQERKPEGAIFVIPVRLDDCDLPFLLHELQWVDFPSNYNRLVLALNARRGKIVSTSTGSPKVKRQDNPNQRKTHIQLIINDEYHLFHKEQEAELIDALSELLNISNNEIRILRVSEGSVKVDLVLPAEAAQTLIHLFQDEKLEIKKLRIAKAEIVRVNLPSSIGEEMIDASSIPMIPKALDLIFGDVIETLQARRKRKIEQDKSWNDVESYIPNTPKSIFQINGGVINSKDVALSQKIDEANWRSNEAKIQHLLSLLEIYQKNYNLARKQLALWGAALVPQRIILDLENAEDEIAKVTRELEDLFSDLYNKRIVVSETLPKGLERMRVKHGKVKPSPS